MEDDGWMLDVLNNGREGPAAHLQRWVAAGRAGVAAEDAAGVAVRRPGRGRLAAGARRRRRQRRRQLPERDLQELGGVAAGQKLHRVGPKRGPKTWAKLRPLVETRSQNPGPSRAVWA
jgi:hypothetical protein